MLTHNLHLFETIFQQSVVFNRWLPLETAARWRCVPLIKKIWLHITTVSFVLPLIFDWEALGCL